MFIFILTNYLSHTNKYLYLILNHKFKKKIKILCHIKLHHIREEK